MNTSFNPLKYERSLIEFRRSKVLDLLAQGLSQSQIAEQLHVSPSCVSLDIQYLECSAKQNIEKQLHEVLPMQYSKTMAGLNQVLKKTWEIVNKEHLDDKTKLQSLALVNECYRLIMELSSDGNVIKEAMAFVRKHRPSESEALSTTTEPETQGQEESDEQGASKTQEEEEVVAEEEEVS